MDPRYPARRIAVILGSVLPGVLIIPDGDDQSPPAAATQWLRIQLDDIDAEPAGRLGGVAAERRDTLVTVDVFQRGAALGVPATPQKVDTVDRTAYIVRSTLSSSALDIPDYGADPTGSTSTGRLLQFTVPALTRRLPPMDGVQRRQVLATATLFAQV